jgi:hypothetical protein
MKRSVILAPIIAALLHATPAAATEIVPLSEPVTTPLKANSVVCDSSESLFLLYESTRLIKSQQPPKSTLATNYFDAMFKVVADNKACFLQQGDYEVNVTSLTMMQNHWIKPAGTMVYGEFEHPLLKKKVFAPLLALPGLGQYLSQLQNEGAAETVTPPDTEKPTP